MMGRMMPDGPSPPCRERRAWTADTVRIGRTPARPKPSSRRAGTGQSPNLQPGQRRGRLPPHQPLQKNGESITRGEKARNSGIPNTRQGRMLAIAQAEKRVTACTGLSSAPPKARAAIASPPPSALERKTPTTTKTTSSRRAGSEGSSRQRRKTQAVRKLCKASAGMWPSTVVSEPPVSKSLKKPISVPASTPHPPNHSPPTTCRVMAGQKALMLGPSGSVTSRGCPRRYPRR